jgi:hypothetical protein
MKDDKTKEMSTVKYRAQNKAARWPIPTNTRTEDELSSTALAHVDRHSYSLHPSLLVLAILGDQCYGFLGIDKLERKVDCCFRVGTGQVSGKTSVSTVRGQ